MSSKINWILAGKGGGWVGHWKKKRKPPYSPKRTGASHRPRDNRGIAAQEKVDESRLKFETLWYDFARKIGMAWPAHAVGLLSGVGGVCERGPAESTRH